MAGLLLTIDDHGAYWNGTLVVEATGETSLSTNRYGGPVGNGYSGSTIWDDFVIGTIT